MGITRTVTTRVHCDVCGEWVTGWESEGIGISREWAKYFVRLQGCTGEGHRRSGTYQHTGQDMKR